MSNLLQYLSPKVQARFEAKFVRGGPDECWIWTAAKDRYGYGRMRVSRQNRGVNAKAHRISWVIENRIDIPQGLCVMHACDSTSCVNPSHLSVGTQQDNLKDCHSKLRHTHGEITCTAKLTEDQVIAIFFDPRLQKQIADDFGIGQQQVSRIKAGVTWRHLGLKPIANIGKTS